MTRKVERRESLDSKNRGEMSDNYGDKEKFYKKN